MFIRKVRKKDPNTKATYFYYQLVESYRTLKGPRQRILLNLGKLDMAPKELKALANRIEELVTGQQCLVPVHDKIERLARHFASLLRKERLRAPQGTARKKDGTWETVDLDTVKTEDVRTVGAEAVGCWA